VKLHAVIVSYRRLPLLQGCVSSFLSTVTIPHSLVVVDNGSPSDVRDWIKRDAKKNGYRFALLAENHYPGYAANRGFEMAPPDADLLMRSDNDCAWLPGWDSELADVFSDPSVGQYGPTAAGDERWTRLAGWPVGGNSIIRKSMFDDGLRYDETPWPEASMQEDHCLYEAIRGMGYKRVWASKPCLAYTGMRDPDYDREVTEARGHIWTDYRL
jgi:glycosyltransferase involved in cell wall biosynthesis